MEINRKLLPFLAAIPFVVVLLFFRLPISNFLDALLVTPIFAEFESGVIQDVVLLFLLAAMVWFSKNLSFRLLARCVGFGLLLYAFQRFNDYWIFTRTEVIPMLAYWDLLAIASLPTLLCCYFGQPKGQMSKESEKPKEGFIEDQAVINDEGDHFKRRAAAAQIADIMLQTVNEKSFAIGILGQYGSGKTSFLNLINFALKDKVVKISFDPWNAISPEMIRREFFDLLAAKIADIDLKMSSLIYSYGRKIARFDGRSLSVFNWFGFFKNGSSIQNSDEFLQINQMLKNIEQKVVITIDDLDRLHPPEIIEVLKLIRNTANFSNVIYMVGYDRAYVQAAIDTFNASSANYLDKIFQLEIPLPKPEEDDLLITLQSGLKTMITPTHFEEFEQMMIPNVFRSRYEKAYKGIFRQGRDVVRFLNSFKITYKLIGEEVDFQCLVLLELIKFRFPEVYDLIYTQSDTFLYEAPLRATHEQYFSPRLTTKKNIVKDVEEVSAFRTYLEKLKKWSEEEILLLDGLFMNLFSGSQYFGPQRKNSISYPLYFEIYFRFRLSSSDLSDKDYQAAKASPDQMRNYMQHCATNNLHKELITRLLQENILGDRQTFETVIRWIFNYGKTFVEKEGKSRFDTQSLIDKIYNYHNSITDKFYKGSPNSYFNFINNLFGSAPIPYLFENELIYRLKEMGEGFVLPLGELTGHQLTYFSRYAETSHGLNAEVVWIFWGARQYYKEPIDASGAYLDHWRFEPELVDKMKIYLARKDPKEFLKLSIDRNLYEQSHSRIEPHVLEMFTEPEEFRNLIEANPEIEEPVKNEYLEFFDKLADKEFKEYVDMDFKTDLHKPKANN